MKKMLLGMTIVILLLSGCSEKKIDYKKELEKQAIAFIYNIEIEGIKSKLLESKIIKEKDGFVRKFYFKFITNNTKFVATGYFHDQSLLTEKGLDKTPKIKIESLKTIQ